MRYRPKNWIAAFKDKATGVLVDSHGMTRFGTQLENPDFKPELYNPVSMPREETYKPFFKPNIRAEEVPYFAY